MRPPELLIPFFFCFCSVEREGTDGVPIIFVKTTIINIMLILPSNVFWGYLQECP